MPEWNQGGDGGLKEPGGKTVPSSKGGIWPGPGRDGSGAVAPKGAPAGIKETGKVEPGMGGKY